MNFKITDTYKIKIEYSALSQLFLMNASYMGGTDSESGPFAFESKVVYFVKEENSIGLYEIKDNIHLSKINSVLLAKFPITEVSSAHIIFDFDQGMKHIYQRRNTLSHASNLNTEHRLDITQSFLYMAEIIDKYLVIKHHVEMATKNPMGIMVTSQVTMKYTFSSYLKSTSYRPTTHPDKTIYSFFETQPKNHVSHIAKFDITKKIVFYYSPNTPVEYIPSLEQSITYWNMMLGQNLLELKILPESIKPFDPGYNIIEWIDSKRDYAYTSLQLDPFSGEILQTYINFPTPLLNDKYMLIGNYVRKHSKKILSEKNNFKEVTIRDFTPAIYSNNATDNQSPAEQLSLLQLLKKDSKSTNPQNIYSKIFQDIVTALITHEIGHALGIKHNFAGSISSNANLNDKNDLYLDYLLNDYVNPKLITSSTVMDYFPFSFLALVGAQIRKIQMNFSWDKLVLDFAYNNIELTSDLDYPYFCSDKDVDEKQFADCKSFDSFSNPIIGSISSLEDNLRLSSFHLAEIFAKQDPDYLNNINPEKISNLLGARETGAELFKIFQPITGNFLTSTKFIQANDDMAYQRQSLLEIKKKLHDILIAPISSSNSHNILIIKKYKELFIDNLSLLLNAENRSYPDITILNQFFSNVENVFLKKYLSYLGQSTFNPLFETNDDKNDFYTALRYLIHSNLFEPSDLPIDEKNVLFYPKHFDIHFPSNDIRHQTASLIFNKNLINLADYKDLQNILGMEVANKLQTYLNNLEQSSLTPINQSMYDQYIKSEYSLLQQINNEI